MTARKRDVFTFRSFIRTMWVLDCARVLCQEKSARELRQGGSDYRCCIPALAGFVSPQSIAPDGKRLFAKDRRRAIGFLWMEVHRSDFLSLRERTEVRVNGIRLQYHYLPWAT